MIKQEIKYQFGNKLREIREKKGVTLKEVARQVGISESMLSQIERSKVSPSIDTLLTITDILEIDMEYLFKDYKKQKKARLIKKDERKSMVTRGITYQQISVMTDPSEEHAIEAFILEVAPGAEKGSHEYGHVGKELGFIIEGSGEFHFGKTVYPLAEGDSITYSSDIPHILKNTGQSTLKTLWIITPPKMLFFKD